MDRLDYAFVIFFITLGPIKCLAPFLHTTANFDAPTKRMLAFRGTIIATIVGLFIVYIGNSMREKWGVGRPDLLVTFGILLLLSALEMLRSAQHPEPAEAPPESPKGLALSPIAFPIIITPYGIVALLVFAAVAENQVAFLEGVFGLFIGIMILNFFAMIFAKQILGFIRPQVLQAIGWVLSVLQASLAVTALMSGLRLGLFAAPVGY
ncbi:MarC family protein [Altererythrobacter salegens]|uniref:UPF0056 membrane protein n=1 Tax=Croceibacterium salegens TaxID=1737568 RepID=A0A6I4SRQ0_9SPHN|nr:MarC family protein [Croceibacterium salegens]MXO58574.1 MarC family protein [Croceibacterium salegens]